jgi:hypothetical protein
MGLTMLFSSLFPDPNINLFGLLFALTFSLIGYKIFFSAKYQKILIDRWLKTVTVLKYGLFNWEKCIYPASDINKFYCGTEADSDDNQYYTICMTLKAGQSLILGGTFDSKAECETIIKTTKTYLKERKAPQQGQLKYL